MAKLTLNFCTLAIQQVQTGIQLVDPTSELTNPRPELAGTAIKGGRVGNQLADPGAEHTDPTGVLLDPVSQGLTTTGQLSSTRSQWGDLDTHLLDTIVDLADPGNVLVNPIVQGHNSGIELLGTTGGLAHALANHVEFLEHGRGVGVGNRGPNLGVQLLHPHLGDNLTDHVQ